MKITDTTPKVDRTFTIELSEIELRSIHAAMGASSHDRRATAAEGIILDAAPFHHLYTIVGIVLRANDN